MVVQNVYAEWVCNVHLKEASEFASPRWPGSYPGGARCSWKISAPEGHLVRLHFDAFALGAHDLGHCNEHHDHVEVIDGSSTGSPSIGLWCGNRSPFHITSSQRDLLVKFASTRETTSSISFGFHVIFDFVFSNETSYDMGGRLDDKFIEMEDVFGETWEDIDGRKLGEAPLRKCRPVDASHACSFPIS
jgi:cubilin